MSTSRRVALVLLLGVLPCFGYSQTTKSGPLNQPLDVYIARLHVLADQMNSAAKVNTASGKRQDLPKSTVITTSFGGTGILSLVLTPGGSNLHNLTLINVLDGKIENSMETMRNSLLVAMAAFDRPKAMGIGDAVTKLCSQALDKKETPFKRTLHGIDLSCTSGIGMMAVGVGAPMP